MKPGKTMSPSVIAIVGGGSKKPSSDEGEHDEGSDDEGMTAIGRELLAAIEKKDAAAIGRALKSGHDYCAPEEAAEDE